MTPEQNRLAKERAWNAFQDAYASALGISNFHAEIHPDVGRAMEQALLKALEASAESC
jgi:hypothetical protein